MWTAASRGLFAAAGIILAALAHASQAGDACESGMFEGIPYTACTIAPPADGLRLFHTAPDGLVFGTFDRVE